MKEPMEKMAKNGSYSCSIELLNFFPRLFWENENWTFFLSIFEKGRQTLPKISFSLHNENLSSGDRKNNFQFVTIIFYYFWKKYLGTFLCSINILQMTTNLVPKSSDNFVCEICDYVTSRKSQYERHLSTPKHKNTTNTTINTIKSSNSFICDCGKEYKHHSSLWNHKKKMFFK